MVTCRAIHCDKACTVSSKCESLKSSCAIISDFTMDGAAALLFLRNCAVNHTVAMNRSAAQESFSKTGIRQFIKFNVLLQKSPIETHAIFEEGLGSNCPSYETVRKWHRLFKAGSGSVRSGRPSTACDEDHVAQVSALLEEDSRLHM